MAQGEDGAGPAEGAGSGSPQRIALCVVGVRGGRTPGRRTRCWRCWRCRTAGATSVDFEFPTGGLRPPSSPAALSPADKANVRAG